MQAVLNFPSEGVRRGEMKLSANKSTHVTIGGKDYLFFGGSNYLGMAQRKELLNAFETAFEKYGLSAGASRLTSGENECLLALEDVLSNFAGVESSLVLPAGFLANQALVEGIADEIDAWIIHPGAHASVKSALRLSGKPAFLHHCTVEHQDAAAVRNCLNLPETLRLGIFAEEIDPLTGSLFDMRRLLRCLQEGDFLILDEAHSFGVLGSGGRGAFEHYGIECRADLIRTGTFSKAVGTYGGFILAAESVVNLVKTRSLCFKGSTSLPPPICSASSAALNLIESDPESTVRGLRDNVRYLDEKLAAENIVRVGDSAVPIFYLESSDRVRKMQSGLSSFGISVPSMGGYFAGQEQIGFRWTIQSAHSRRDLDLLVRALLESG